MLLASLERPDGSLASPVRGDLAVALPTVALLLPAIIPAAAAGAADQTICRNKNLIS